jgi:hypothetical protein
VKSTRSRSWSDRGLLAPGRFLFRALGLQAVPAPPHVFALEAGRLRYGRFLRASGGTLEFEEQRAVELPAGLFPPGVLGSPAADAEELERALGTLLEGVSARVDQASLVLPDPWLRLAFVETGELPRRAQREEVLRWKLKRMLPVRIEDLRLEAVPAPTLPTQQEPRRWLVGFALESLLAQLETVFAARRVWLGRITNESLALLPALPQLPNDNLLMVAKVHTGGYTLLFARRGEPILHRFKSLDPALPPDQLAALVQRDLRLTRAFLAEQLPGAVLGGILLAAAPEEQGRWQGWLEGELGEGVEPLERRHLPLRSSEALAWWQIAPLLGAAYQEIA